MEISSTVREKDGVNRKYHSNQRKLWKTKEEAETEEAERRRRSNVQLSNFHGAAVVSSSGFDHSRVESKRLLINLSKSGWTNETCQLFDELLERDKYVWDTMIAAYANSGKLNEAEKILHETPSKVGSPGQVLYLGIVSIAVKTKLLDCVGKCSLRNESPANTHWWDVLRLSTTMGFLQSEEQIHGYIVKTGFDDNVFVVSGLVDMYAMCKCSLKSVFSKWCLIAKILLFRLQCLPGIPIMEMASVP